MSTKRIINSIVSCKFDEEICTIVENLASSNPTLGLSVLDGMTFVESVCD